MPKNNKQQFIYALITVFITVNCFVCYCLSIEKGGMSIDIIKDAYSINTWILPIPLVLLELVIALSCEMFVGSPTSIKIASKLVDFNNDKPLFINLAIICSTVIVMCPLMSFIATILYNLIPSIICGNISNALINFIPKFLQTVVINFPFALLSQVFFIQPLVKRIFGLIYKNA